MALSICNSIVFANERLEIGKFTKWSGNFHRSVPNGEENGRVPFDQNFRKFRFKVKWNRNFRKLISKISVNFLRLSFFPEIWKFRKFSVPFDISTRYESAPVPLVVPESYKMAACRYYTGCKTICHSSSLLLIAYPPQKP